MLISVVVFVLYELKSIEKFRSGQIEELIDDL
jgi:flagellar biosynthesis regulator FlaF